MILIFVILRRPNIYISGKIRTLMESEAERQLSQKWSASIPRLQAFIAVLPARRVYAALEALGYVTVEELGTSFV